MFQTVTSSKWLTCSELIEAADCRVVGARPAKRAKAAG